MKFKFSKAWCKKAAELEKGYNVSAISPELYALLTAPATDSSTAPVDALVSKALQAERVKAFNAETDRIADEMVDKIMKQSKGKFPIIIKLAALPKPPLRQWAFSWSTDDNPTKPHVQIFDTRREARAQRRSLLIDDQFIAHDIKCGKIISINVPQPE